MYTGLPTCLIYLQEKCLVYLVTMPALITVAQEMLDGKNRTLMSKRVVWRCWKYRAASLRDLVLPLRVTSLAFNPLAITATLRKASQPKERDESLPLLETTLPLLCNPLLCSFSSYIQEAKFAHKINSHTGC